MKNAVRCPKCDSTISLWEGAEASGYFPVDEYLERKGSWEQDHAYIESTGEYGCGECQWIGGKDDFVKLGNDGNPLPHIHRDQLEFGPEDYEPSPYDGTYSET